MARRRSTSLALLLAAGLAGGAVFLAPAANPAAPQKAARFTVSEGTNFAATLSPDGRTAAFDLQGRIWTVPARGGKATALTPSMEEARFPVWSPDGAWLTFQYYSDNNWRVAVMRKDGTGLRNVTNGVFDDREPSWSPDGKTIVFGSDRAHTYDVWAVDVVSGALRQVTDEGTEEFQPATAPDGTRIAYVRQQGNAYSLVINSPSGGGVLVEGNTMLALPRWSPDGSKIAFNAFNIERGEVALNVVDVASGAVTKVSADEEDVFPTGAAWAGNGELVYGADGQIKRRALTGGPAKTIPFRAEFTVAPRVDYPKRTYDFTSTTDKKVLGILRPTVSPDGAKVAFTALGDLWLLHVGNPKPERLTQDAFLDVDPAWSPDGRSLAYVSDRRGTGTMDLYVRDMATGKERRVTETVEDVNQPAWSPDGKSIAVLMMDSTDWHAGRLHIVDAASGAMRKVHDGTFLPSTPSWSADGRIISMMALQDSSDRIRHGSNAFLMIDVETGESHFVSPDPNRSISSRAQFGPIWAPDGSRIAYLHEGLLWTVAVDRTGTPIAAPQIVANEYASYPSWTGDSASLVYLAVDKLKRASVTGGGVQDIPLDLTWRRNIPAGRMVIQAGRVFDGRSSRYLTDVDVVVDGNVITEIVPRRAAWPGARIVDARDRTLIPGMFQMHIHHFVTDGEKPGRAWLSFGITSVREPGAEPYEALERKEAWAAGARIGPRQFYSVILEGSRVYYWMNTGIVAGAQVDMEMDRAVRLDYDFIKTYERMTFPVQKRIIDLAHASGLMVASHEIYPTAEFGTDVVEHITTRDRMEYSDRLSLQRKLYDDALQIMKHADIYIVPTAAGRAPGASFIQQMNETPDILALPQMQAFVPKYIKAGERLMAYQRRLYGDRAPMLSRNEQNAIARIHKEGILIAPGTDGGTATYGYANSMEVRHFAASGLGNARALQAATLDAAKATGVDRYLGSIEPGKLADMVIIDGDPLRDMKDIFKVDRVIADGHLYAQEELLRAP